jgi:hypothetical protein
MTSRVQVGGAVKESEIQKAILDYLAARHILAFRMQTGASVSEYKGKTRMVRYGTPGMADILAFPMRITWENEGVIPLWLEVKADNGKQSEMQKSFQAQVEDEGHVYAIVRSIEDVERILA